MQIPLLLDRTRSTTLTAQLVDQLRDAIAQRRIPAGSRLPSSRELADQLAVSRNTVTRAYDTLLAEGYIDTRPASGVFAATQLPNAAMRDALPTTAFELPPDTPAMPVPTRQLRSQRLVNENQTRITYDFFPGRPSASFFPLKTWRRLMQAALRRGASGMAEYSAPTGLSALRTAIANHLASARGILVDPAQIVVVNGIQEGISLAARLLVTPGQSAVVEEPCYQGAAYVLEEAGAALVGVPVDESGLIPDLLPDAPASLLYLTPSHQYPTGHTLSPERRTAIAHWARDHGCYILEDDYDCDFRYEGSPQLAMAATAPDCVIYLGTFSKSLGAGIRVGFMVLPPQLAEAVGTLKALLNNGNAWLEQAVLAEFLRSGSYAAHVARIRGHYRESRDATLAALRHHFGEANVSGESAGLHVLWYLPPGVPDAPVLETLGRRTRVGVYSFASAGVHTAAPTNLQRRSIVLGYAALTPRQIEQGIARLSTVIDDALDAQQIDVNQLVAARPVLTAPGPAIPPRKLALRNRQRPALRSRRLPGAGSHQQSRRSSPVATIQSIYRYPVKGLSAQALSGVSLSAGKPFPHDRIFALARPGSTFDEENPQWAKKGMFVMLMLEEALATVTTNVDVDTGRITIMRGNDLVLAADLNDADGRASVEALVHELVPALRAPPKLLRSVEGHFMDKPDSVISVINLATVRALEQQWGHEIDPLRFRANIYIDGVEPWDEFNWIGSDVRLGEAVCRVDRRNGRCSATNVNPRTGRRDMDIPGSLRTALGHKDLGVYLTVTTGGAVAVGDSFEIETTADTAAGAALAFRPPAPSRPSRRFICRGCYYIYDEAAGVPAQGIPAGTPFAAIPATWRCPDCGTEKATFRPHVG